MESDVRPAQVAEAPFFSIVIPCYNREVLIRRAVDSCLIQDFPDFEVIVVDDASTDDSAAVVSSYRDPRVRLVRHADNRGLSPSRNTGIDHARGPWVISFDDDDELLPDALSRIYKLASAAPPEIKRLAFMQRLDDGSPSPNPPLVDEVWDFTTFLRRRERMRLHVEFLACTRRETFAELRFPDSRAWETSYYYRFGRRFKTRTLPETMLLRHTDARNRLSRSSPWRMILDAADQADAIADVLAEQEADLARLSPALLRRVLVLCTNYSFLAGHRAVGVRYAWRRLKRKPLDLMLWVALGTGLLGPWFYALGLSLLWRLRGAAR